jgi:hypothetical protein
MKINIDNVLRSWKRDRELEYVWNNVDKFLCVYKRKRIPEPCYILEIKTKIIDKLESNFYLEEKDLNDLYELTNQLDIENVLEISKFKYIFSKISLLMTEIFQIYNEYISLKPKLPTEIKIIVKKHLNEAKNLINLQENNWLSMELKQKRDYILAVENQIKNLKEISERMIILMVVNL